MQRILTNDTLKHKGKKIKVAGWIATRRDHGKIVFLDLRDRQGIIQVVSIPQEKKAYAVAQTIRPEWVVEIEGEVQERPEKMRNPDISTGNVEIAAHTITVLAEAKTLPFAIDTDGYEIDEEKRLTYRYLDLRRARLKTNLETRHKAIQFIRNYLTKENFVEIETPVLTKSTPEGARDYVVPARLYPGEFYALPQSPQQYKQLLQVAGFEKYFQIVRCFRDEDPRTDRQPEFTQLDIEMSFVEQEDILGTLEGLYIKLVQELFPEKKIQEIPFPRLSYKEAMGKHKSDRPDLRKDTKDPDELAFAFVVDFPMFEWKETEKRWDAVHHPFTRPQEDNIAAIKKNPKDVLAFQYDLVLNGHEVAGGSLRTYKPEILEAVFETMGNKKADIQEKFKHLLESFTYGAPPHGGIASGLDRLLSILLHEPNIREVIPFPKTGDGRDPMMNTPSEISAEQLKELHLNIEKKSTKKK